MWDFQKLIISLCFLLMVSPNVTLSAGCEEYEAEADAISGISPRFNDDGSLRAILAYGEATFLTAKRSLIRSARQKAELDAKRSFSNFLTESVSAEMKVRSLLEVSQATNETGETEGYARELSSVVDEMQSSTSAVLRSLVKLDECVNIDENFILVTLGWKPQINNSPDKVVELNQSIKNDAPAEMLAQTSENIRELEEDCENSVKLISVITTGYGRSQTSAIDDGIRIAVSQVFGEVFASSIASSSVSMSAAVTGAGGETEGAALVIDAQTQSSVSSTAGFVNSYSILNTSRQSGDFEIVLDVQIPKHCQNSEIVGKQKIVVVKPNVTADRTWTNKGTELAEIIQREVESLLNETVNLTVLNRSDMSVIDAELSQMTGAGFSLSEMAKHGNKLGADYIVTVEFADFETRRKKIKVGNGKEVDLFVTSAQAWIKVVDVVTTNLVFSVRVPLSSKSVAKGSNENSFAITMAHNLATVVGNKIGGGFSQYGKEMLQETAKKIDNFAVAKARLEKSINKVKGSAADDW
jgi:hypothetical protein